jgi:hypothetical protein
MFTGKAGAYPSKDPYHVSFLRCVPVLHGQDLSLPYYRTQPLPAKIVVEVLTQKTQCNNTLLKILTIFCKPAFTLA